MIPFQVLERVKNEAEQLAAGVQTTSQVSERVSRKIRELDMAQSHIHATLARIHIVVDRTNAIDGVKQASLKLFLVPASSTAWLQASLN